MKDSRAWLLASALGAAACAPRGYFVDDKTGRIYTQDSFGKVTKWYEPGTPEHRAIAARFWPDLAGPGAPAPGEPKGAARAPGRKERMTAFMRGLDKDQWHILLDLDLWSGDDKADLARLEEMERVAAGVKGLSWSRYLEFKAAVAPALLRDRLSRGDWKDKE